jgi:2-oxoglutarate ferredoxin oxidoreductase subunit alpha
MLDSGKNFGRYLDVDGDGIPWRTIPGTHPTKGAFFSRGTTRNAYAKYSEAGTDYVYNMERLRHKLETAKKLVPAPVLQPASQPTRFGAIYYGSTSPAMAEASALLEAQGVHVDTCACAASRSPTR